jgi:UDP-GlcNAc3NAcA epimerase
MSKRIKISTIVGARPQFVKAAVVSLAIIEHNRSGSDIEIVEEIVHTGQHYDESMSEIFFNQLGIPEPTANLQVGSGTHGKQTGMMLDRLEELYLQDPPDIVLNYGDTNSTLASAIVASKMHIPIAHIESGLRSFNRKMPEEINRVVTDHLAEWLFCPTQHAIDNLAKEGVTENVIHCGDVMFDAARIFGELSDQQSTIMADLGLSKNGFFLTTCHRAENTDSEECLRGIFAALSEVGSELCPVLLPLHPRTKKQLEAFGMYEGAMQDDSLKIVPPISFLDMVALEKNAKLILTDSGGVQKEAYFHGVPCVTLRTETEWIELVEAGWNVIAGSDQTKIVDAVRMMLQQFEKNRPPVAELYGDGFSANQIVKHLIT